MSSASAFDGDRTLEADHDLDQAFVRRLMADGGMPRVELRDGRAVWVGFDGKPWTAAPISIRRAAFGGPARIVNPTLSRARMLPQPRTRAAAPVAVERMRDPPADALEAAYGTSRPAVVEGGQIRPRSWEFVALAAVGRGHRDAFAVEVEGRFRNPKQAARVLLTLFARGLVERRMGPLNGGRPMYIYDLTGAGLQELRRQGVQL